MTAEQKALAETDLMILELRVLEKWDGLLREVTG
jgi:hypothetical protein